MTDSRIDMSWSELYDLAEQQQAEIERLQKRLEDAEYAAACAQDEVFSLLGD